MFEHLFIGFSHTSSFSFSFLKPTYLYVHLYIINANYVWAIHQNAQVRKIKSFSLFHQRSYIYVCCAASNLWPLQWWKASHSITKSPGSHPQLKYSTTLQYSPVLYWQSPHDTQRAYTPAVPWQLHTHTHTEAFTRERVNVHRHWKANLRHRRVQMLCSPIRWPHFVKDFGGRGRDRERWGRKGLPIRSRPHTVESWI